MSTILSDAGLQFADGNTQVYASVPVRQTVLSGPVDSSGFSAFGGSTGSATVTASGTLISTASSGVTNRTGSIVNPSWTGLSTNGTMYLGLTVNTDGTCTPFVTALAPNYQWGGTFAVASGQRTFNIQSMQMQNGNGSTASQNYDVFVGEVTVAAGVVSAIVWYALMGRYDSGFTATLPATAQAISRNHNIGSDQLLKNVKIKCTTAELGYLVGYIVEGYYTHGGTSQPLPIWNTSNVVGFTTGSTLAWAALVLSSGAVNTLTNASWSYKIVVQRGW